MKLYNAIVRLDGSVQHEVGKTGITAAEIIILQHLHGDDAVINVVEVGETKRALSEEYDRLQFAYDKLDRPSVVAKLFGREYAARLPEEATTVPVTKEARKRSA